MAAGSLEWAKFSPANPSAQLFLFILPLSGASYNLSGEFISVKGRDGLAGNETGGSPRSPTPLAAHRRMAGGDGKGVQARPWPADGGLGVRCVPSRWQEMLVLGRQQRYIPVFELTPGQSAGARRVRLQVNVKPARLSGAVRAVRACTHGGPGRTRASLNNAT